MVHSYWKVTQFLSVQAMSNKGQNTKETHHRRRKRGDLTNHNPAYKTRANYSPPRTQESIFLSPNCEGKYILDFAFKEPVPPINWAAVSLAPSLSAPRRCRQIQYNTHPLNLPPQSRQSAKIFLQSSELKLPHPLSRRWVCPPPTLWSGGSGWGVGEVPIPTTGEKA